MERLTAAAGGGGGAVAASVRTGHPRFLDKLYTGADPIGTPPAAPHHQAAGRRH
jgi:hypothetical protein